jgi:5-methyltetrahydropteroyltriglutamate--homocysteine methyltransferase
MSPTAQLGGIHPRSEQLIELTRSYDRGKVERSELDRRIEQDTVDLIKLQEDSRFETLSDGALAWQDQLRPVVESLEGVTTGTRYDRWFDTNTFYKKPAIEKKISTAKFEPKNFIRADLLPKSKSWKVTLPGPYTFSQLAENLHYDAPSELVYDVAHAQNQIIRGLAAVGISEFQISEPCLVYRPYRESALDKAEIDTALAAIQRTVEGVKAHFLVQTYFGDARKILPALLKLPVESIGFDLFETDYAQLKIETDKKLALGIVDSRESNVEDPNWIAETATRASKHIIADDLVFVPNSDLKFVPRKVGDAKARALAQATKVVQERA